MLKRRDLVIDCVIFGLQKAGGISRLWADLLLELEKRALHEGLCITALIPSNSNVEWKRISKQVQTIEIIKRKRFKWGRHKGFLESLYLTCIALLVRPKKWHSSYYVGYPLKYSGEKILSFYDMIAERTGEAPPYDTQMKYRSLKSANSILSISDHSKKDLLHFWPEFESKKISITPLWTPIEISQEEINEDLTTYPYLLFLGKRHGYKNFLPFLKQFLKEEWLNSYHLIAVGGEERWSEAENQLITEYKMNHRIHLEKVLPFEEVQHLIAMSEAVVYPSLYEGFGLPVLEAFHHGVPVLAFNSSSIPEITGPEYPLVDPEKPEEMMKILRKLIDEKQKWTPYATERCSLFSREKMLHHWIEHYAF